MCWRRRLRVIVHLGGLGRGEQLADALDVMPEQRWRDRLARCCSKRGPDAHTPYMRPSHRLERGRKEASRASRPVTEAGLAFEFNDVPWDTRSGEERPACVPPFSGASQLGASRGGAEPSRGAADEAVASRAKSLTLLGVEPGWDAWDAFRRLFLGAAIDASRLEHGTEPAPSPHRPSPHPNCVPTLAKQRAG
jgi:hypothetical protein